MIRTSSKLFLVIAGIIMIVYLLQQVNIIPSFKNIFKPKAVLIDNTPILITEIKSMAQLMTITVYDEVVIDSLKYAQPGLIGKILSYASPLPVPAGSYSELVLIAKGKVIAGTNLQELRENDFTVVGDSVSVTVPSATILDIITNPSDIETFSETGNWTPNEITIVKLQAKKKLVYRALQQNILHKANQQALLVIDKFLRAAGFVKVTVRTRN